MKNIKDLNGGNQKSPADYVMETGIVRSRSQANLILFLAGTLIVFVAFFMLTPSKPKKTDITPKELSKMKSLKLEPTPDFGLESKIR